MQRQVRVSSNDGTSDYNRKNESIPIRINQCFTFRYFTEAILVILNLALLLKTSSNFAAYFNNSSRLIADYDGALLLSESFKFYFISMNCLLFIGSSLGLITFLFVSSQKIRMKLVKCYILIQTLSAFLIVLIMAKLWFSPFKLELNERGWLDDIKKYTYNSESQLTNYENIFGQQQQQLLFQTTPNIILSPPTLSDSLPTTPENDLNYESNNNNNLANNMKRSYTYVDLVDKLQYALGCCGILSPDDWRQENQLLGLLAPSCCLQPTHLEISIPSHSGGNKILLNSTTKTTEFAASTPNQRQLMRNFISISYCKIELSNTIGCQNLLSNRQIQFTFNLRMSLLFLLSILIVLIMAALNFNAPSHLSSTISPMPQHNWSSNHRATVLTAQPVQQFYLLNRTSNQPSCSSTSISTSPSSSQNLQGQQPASINSLTKVVPFQQQTQTNNHHNETTLEGGRHIYQINPNQQAIIGQDTNDGREILNCDTVLTIS